MRGIIFSESTFISDRLNRSTAPKQSAEEMMSFCGNMLIMLRSHTRGPHDKTYSLIPLNPLFTIMLL